MARVVLAALATAWMTDAFSRVVRAAERPATGARWERPHDLPSGRFRDQFQRLPLSVQERVLTRLRGLDLTEADLTCLHLDAAGDVLYACSLRGGETATLEIGDSGLSIQTGETVPVQPFPEHLLFHSRPGAPNVLYLNFSGETVRDTAWNSELRRTSIPAVAFSTDSDLTTFNQTEQTIIRRVWQRVAEDFAPFDIDVTTRRPSTFTRRTAHALITRSTDANGAVNPHSTAGGVAYMDVFNTSGYARYRPAWIYADNLGNHEAAIAEAVSHEIGHNLGLSHDGRTDGTEYYAGHGSGEISWGPIMGSAYQRQVTQWSKGEYHLANNTQDDLAIIAGRTAYRPDDHGNTPATATPLVLTEGAFIVSTTPDADPGNRHPENKGVIERNSDVDVFSFVTGSGPVSLFVDPWIVPAGSTRGGNLDVRLELRNAAGTLLLVDDPPARTGASIQTNLIAGLYFLQVGNSGAGDPFQSRPTGYTAYGSLGQYFIRGELTPANGLIVPPLAELEVADIIRPDTGSHPFTVTYSDNVAIDISTIGPENLRVVDPDGGSRPVRFLSVDLASDGTPRVATYEVDPPHGPIWQPVDNGVYTVWLEPDQVGDVEGAFAAPGALGRFRVEVPIPLYQATMDEDPQWTLEPQWEHGRPAYGGNGPAGGFTGESIIGYNLRGNYPNNLSLRHATTPEINCAGVSTVTLRFRRWLRLRANDTALIEVSTNGVEWATVWSTTRAVADTGWQEVYQALPGWVAGSLTVRLRWGIASNLIQNDIGWNLDDVEVLGGGVLDVTPPAIALAVAPIVAAGSPSHSFTLTYTDDSAVRVSSLDDEDVVVVGPDDTRQPAEFIGVDLPDDGSPRVATYSIRAPGEAWTDADNGLYQIVVQEGEVTDIFGNAIPRTIAGAFTVAIPGPHQALVVQPVSVSVPPGGSADFTIRLAEPPAFPIAVTVERLSGSLNLEVAGGVPHEFNAGNWSEPASIRIESGTQPDPGLTEAVFECRAAGLTPVTVRVQEIASGAEVGFIVTVDPPDWGRVEPDGGVHPAGTVLELLAIPALHHQFIEWSGALSSRQNPLTVTLGTPLTLQANFGHIFTRNHPTPHAWLAAQGWTDDFETAVTQPGANGLPLWQSYVAGLDPADPDSRLRLEWTLAAGGRDWVLRWRPVPDRLHSIHHRTQHSEEFQPLPGAIDLPWPIHAVTNPPLPAAPAHFFRLEVRLP